MRRIAMLGMALALGGCALESGETGGDETTGEAQEASSFSTEWSTTHILRSRPIQVALGGTITVISKGDFADRAGCPSSYSIELIRFFNDPKGKPAEEVVGIARSYPLNQAHSELWTALVAGTYRLQFSTTTLPKKCSLHGVVTVNVKP